MTGTQVLPHPRGRRPGALDAPDLTRNLPWLYVGRVLRSLATSFLGVITPLYLARVGYGSATVGVVFTLSSVITACIVVGVGVLSDHVGRRRVLAGLGLLGALGAAALAVTASPVLVTIGCGLSSVGRGGGAGSGGAWGPFFPAEQPLLAASVSDRRRTAVFATIGFLGVLAGAAGSLVAFVPDWLHSLGWAWAAGYRALFALAALLSLAVGAVSLALRDPPPHRAELASSTPRDRTGMPAAGLTGRQLITRLGLTNAINGLGFGFLGPILVYWFYRRYGVGPGDVGLLYAVANALSALPYLGAARLSAWLGAVNVVVVSRAVSVAALLSMAWAPTFALAAAAFVLRSGVNSLSIPARQSYVMGVAPGGRRGAVAAIGALPAQVTASLSPVVAGALMNAFLDVPVYGAALFIGANAAAYWLSFRHAPPPEEEQADRTARFHPRRTANRPVQPTPDPDPPVADRCVPDSGDA